MLRLLDRGADGMSMRRRVSADPLLADASSRRVLEQLTQARLVTLDGDAVVIAHEAVATAWPRLDAWLEEDAESARTLRAVESAAAAWQTGGRDDDDLLRGARLHSALDWRDAAHPDLTGIEGALLDASADREQHELRALSARAARDRRRNRVLGAALGGAAVLLVAAVVAGASRSSAGRRPRSPPRTLAPRRSSRPRSPCARPIVSLPRCSPPRPIAAGRRRPSALGAVRNDDRRPRACRHPPPGGCDLLGYGRHS